MNMIERRSPHQTPTRLLATQARSSHIRLLPMLKCGRFCGTVHSVFDRAVNIRCDATGELITLVASGMDNAPNTLVVALASFAGTEITVGDRVSVADDRLSIEDKITVTLAGVTLWRQPAWTRSCPDDQLRDRLALARCHLEKQGTGGGMFTGPDGSAAALSATDMLQRTSHKLLDALKREDLPLASEAVGHLIGLGPGLTPSGDDFLVGLLAALAAVRQPRPVIDLFRAAVVATSKARTNDISHMAILKAAEGEVRETVGHLLAVLLGGEQTDLYPAMDAVLSIGFSSGTDIACGLLAGLDVVLAIEGRGHKPSL